MRPDFDADVSGSREGSTSPSTRKRKKVSQRRKSLGESNNLLGKILFYSFIFPKY
jgi:hypothetical protein